MTGWGSAHSAVSILNATATGIGCSLAVEGGVEALWTWTETPGLALEGVPDDRLATAVRELVAPARAGARASVRSAFPAHRGLKTSSAAAAALLVAARRDLGHRITVHELVRDAVAVSRTAGITLTGALDDQMAVVMGGCRLTDNRKGEAIAHIPVRPWAVAVWVPEASISKLRVAAVDPAPIRAEVEGLPEMVLDGRIPEAMTANGRAFTGLYERAGLPVDGRAAAAALAAGALGAGLSGTGPSVAALFRHPVALPAVLGGAWRWTTVVAGKEQELRM
ncbi:MAG: shikimate kinase [Thermoplasmatota archaeon]